ncbi:hypothetical protein F4694_001564 [Bacillus niacini]|uniref:Uncharacterized protein n=1 Tax=Neobacillus niacini TaxID=86668 RepID=A0A852TAB2_9BACI|nr:hypothetical protein [Neobacillus niacini]
MKKRLPLFHEIFLISVNDCDNLLTDSRLVLKPLHNKAFIKK